VQFTLLHKSIRKRVTLASVAKSGDFLRPPHNILYVDGHFGVANLLAILSAMLSPDKGFHEAFTVNFSNRGAETAVWIGIPPFPCSSPSADWPCFVPACCVDA